MCATKFSAHTEHSPDIFSRFALTPFSFSRSWARLINALVRVVQSDR